MKTDYFEIVLSFARNDKGLRDALIDFAKNRQIPRDQIVETNDLKASRLHFYFTSQKAAAAYIKQFTQAHIRGARLSQKFLSYEDWADKWKDDYRIQTLGRRFVIVPAWRKKEFRQTRYGNRIPIVIDPLSAFGSGEHETTKLMTRMLENMRGEFCSFLDIGTGTGILAVVAAHLGAKDILGFDSDKPSVRCAQFNFSKNVDNMKAEFICRELARFKPRKQYDLAAANINSHILENYRSEIVGSARKGGWVLVSGILRQTYDSFREAFDGKDLRVVKILRGRRWVSILYRKK